MTVSSLTGSSKLMTRSQVVRRGVRRRNYLCVSLLRKNDGGVSSWRSLSITEGSFYVVSATKQRMLYLTLVGRKSNAKDTDLV